MYTDRLTRYAPSMVFIGVVAVLMLVGAIQYWRKGGHPTTQDPSIIIIATATPVTEPRGAVGYFDYLNPSTAVSFSPSDIEGPIARAEGDWRLVLLRGGGQVWYNSNQASLVDLSPRRTPVIAVSAPIPTIVPAVIEPLPPVAVDQPTPWVVEGEMIGEVVDWDGHVTQFTVR